MTVLLIIFLIILICFSAFLSGSETALFSLSAFTYRSYRTSNDTRKRLIAHLLENPRHLLMTIMMLNVLSNILVQNVVSNIFGAFHGWGLKVGLPLGLTLIFGEILPKSVALPSNQSISYYVAPFIAFVARILGPIRTILTKITSYVSRIIFFFLRKEKEISLDELHHVLKTSKARGILHVEESDLAEGYLDLQDSMVKELMRPREEVHFYDINEPLSKLIHLMVDLELSRIPVCDQDLEKILGIVSTRGFFFHKESIQNPEDLRKILSKPFYVPESMKGWTLLQQLKEKAESLAIVVDEYGSVSGLITNEDLTESVLGEISDRRDVKSHYSHYGENVIIASGKLELDELEDLFGVDLPKKSSVVTIGGWLTDQLGDIPQTGTKYVTDDFLFYILAAEPNRVRRIYIRKLKAVKKK